MNSNSNKNRINAFKFNSNRRISINQHNHHLEYLKPPQISRCAIHNWKSYTFTHDRQLTFYHHLSLSSGVISNWHYSILFFITPTPSDWILISDWIRSSSMLSSPLATLNYLTGSLIVVVDWKWHTQQLEYNTKFNNNNSIHHLIVQAEPNRLQLVCDSIKCLANKSSK